MDYHALEKMTVNNLREEAKKHGAKGVTGMKKDELIALLAEKLAIEVPQKTAKPKKTRVVLDKKTLKKKIVELKGLRTTAQSSNDKKRAELLRRRIHRLKRQMRTAT